MHTQCGVTVVDSIDLLTLTLIGGGRYCLLALCFTFVWWSSRTFFITAGAFVSLSATVLYLLATSASLPVWLAGIAAIGLCVGLGILFGGTVFEPFVRRIDSGASGPSFGGLGNVVLDCAIVSFALYLLIINAIQWLFGGVTDAITLRAPALDTVRTYAVPGIPLGVRLNGIGFLEMVVAWGACVLILAALSSRLGLKLRAIKSNIRLFDQITGSGLALRLTAFGICSGVAALAGIVMLFTSRVDVSGGLSVVLGAMVIMVLGTQTRRIALLPLFSLAFAFLEAVLQGHGLSLWVQPLTLSILLGILLLSPRGLVRDIHRIEESLEA